MTERRALLALGAGALAVGIVWWSPSVPSGFVDEGEPGSPRFDVTDINPVLLAEVPEEEVPMSVRGRLAPNGDVVGTVGTADGLYRIRVSATDGSVRMQEVPVVLETLEQVTLPVASLPPGAEPRSSAR